MTKEQLKDLLTRAADATREYASAIDNQLYRLGSYYGAEKEKATYALAEELEQAANEFTEHRNPHGVDPCDADALDQLEVLFNRSIA